MSSLEAISVNNTDYIAQKPQENTTLQVVKKTENKEDKSNLIMKGLALAGIVATGVLLVRSGKLSKIVEKSKEIVTDSDAFATKAQRLWKNKNLTNPKDIMIKDGYLVNKNTNKYFTGRICYDNLEGASIVDVKKGIVTKQWKLVWDSTKHSYRCKEKGNVIHEPQVIAKQLEEKAKQVEAQKLKTAAERDKKVDKAVDITLDVLESILEEVITKAI